MKIFVDADACPVVRIAESIAKKYQVRQQCAFSKESSKIKGCGILKQDFYTIFIPNFSGFGAVTWLVEKMVKYDLVNRT